MATAIVTFEDNESNVKISMHFDPALPGIARVTDSLAQKAAITAVDFIVKKLNALNNDEENENE